MNNNQNNLPFHGNFDADSSGNTCIGQKLEGMRRVWTGAGLISTRVFDGGISRPKLQEISAQKHQRARRRIP